MQSVSEEPYDLEHPEIFTPQLLKEILIQHNVPEDICSSNRKEKLLQLYRNIVLPLPQRKYRMNRRGTFLLNQRSKQEKLHKKDITAILNQPSLTQSSNNTESDLSLRFKPSSTNEKKMIKLSCSRFTNGFTNSTHNEVKNQKNVLNSDCKIMHLINDTLTSRAKSDLVTKPIHSSENKRKSLEIEKNMDKTSNDPPPKKKHKPITWP